MRRRDKEKIMKNLIDYDEITLCAEVFLQSAYDGKPEIYKMNAEEMIVFLSMFARGMMQQFRPQNTTLDWCAKLIETSSEANGNSDVKEFASNMAMTFRAARIPEEGA